jgi:hypothetical protein
MRNRSFNIVLVGMSLVMLVTVSGCDMIRGYLEANRRAKEWDGPVKEITFEKLDKDGKVFDIELHSRIDAPVDVVWAAMKEPERLAEFSDQYKKSELLAESGNSKDLEILVMALGNLQQFKMRLTFDDANKTVTLETLQSTLADIEGSYQIEPSPDGTKTLYIYKATQTDKIALPISTDVQRSALKESFVNQVKAIKKQIGVS